MPRPSHEDDPVEKARQRWADAGHPDEAGFVVMVSMVRSYAVMVRRLEEILKPFDLTLTLFETLILLSFTRDGRMPVMRLRDLLIVHGSSATYLIDRLEKAGWVERERSTRDRRVTLVHITPAGRRHISSAVAALGDAGFGVIGDMSRADQKALADLLAALRGSPPPALA